MAGPTLAAENKKLHPFFAAPKSLQPDADPTDITPADDPPEMDDSQNRTDDPDGQDIKPSKRKKRKSMEGADADVDDAKKPQRGRPKKVLLPGQSTMMHFSKKNGGEIKDAGTSGQPNAATQESVGQSGAPPAGLSTQTQTRASKVGAEEVADKKDVIGDDTKPPPKKMLQFNPKTGTIGSPPKSKVLQPSKKQAAVQDAAEDTTKAPSKARATRRSKRIATISYGLDDASRTRIGTRIDSILEEATEPLLTRKTRIRISPRAQQQVRDFSAVDVKCGSKAARGSNETETHPFFTGKAKQAASTADPAPVTATNIEAVRIKPSPASTRPRIFSSTPFSPRKPRPAVPSAPLPQFGVKSLGLKTPGAQHPAWPPMGMVHIRGSNTTTNPIHHAQAQEQMAARKSKGKRIHIDTSENLLENFAMKLQISEAVKIVRDIHTDKFLPPPVELRLPQKHFESGAKLEGRLRQELRNHQHPALAQLRKSLVTSLSALDRYTCESASWVQKYTPTSATEVLQCGKEAFLLRSWLEAMKVLSVDIGDARAKPAKPPKKKRKKNKDDFIVDNDEDADDMDEVSDLEQDWSPDSRGIKKTVIRTGDNATRDSKNPGRLTNTVVISGPHGCGKTSAVYAIAKELDFEVFEINAGSRRSGKDILEKIGDMTRNHLVQHHQTEALDAAIDEEEVAQDIKSGKQATMNSFFKPKAATKPTKPRPAEKEISGQAKTEAKKASAKNQKQSLILLDEIDILYEEDKQFWTTVITLIAQSKRPFIMTCNDENLVPLQSLSLHGIFRFNAPPPDLAVDRMLIIAACEGHVLRRNAVEALYDARQQDLRACLMDLNCWCQIAVGDNRGGMDWLIPRWPKGCDMDGEGSVIRVISQDTYVEGMGWLCHDVVCDKTEQGDLEEELVQEVNDFWQFDLANWHDSLDLSSWAATLETTSETQLSVLTDYEEFTDALSLADLSSAVTSPASSEVLIDCTHPEMTEKARYDYISGRRLLDAPLKSTYDCLATALPISLKCLARRTLQASASTGGASKLSSLNEGKVVSKIRRHSAASSTGTALSRDDFSIAFDVLAISEREANSMSSYLEPSVFDGIMRNIVVDVAPYVRSILAFEKELQKQRQKLSILLSQGGTKRGRKTRAAHAALEGGSRSTVRRDKWFEAELNGVLVMRTGGEGWVDAVQETAPSSNTASASPAGSAARKYRARRIVFDGYTDENGSESDMDGDG
ncbi:unnamed protein product [Discula destructiva]